MDSPFMAKIVTTLAGAGIGENRRDSVGMASTNASLLTSSSLSDVYDLARAALQEGTASTNFSSSIIQMPLVNKSGIFSELNLEEIRVGSILSILSVTSLADGGTLEAQSNFWISMEVAAFLALMHWNQRTFPFDADNFNAPLLQSCNFFMILDYWDAQLSPIVVGRIMQQEFIKRPTSSQQNTTSSNQTAPTNGTSSMSALRSTVSYLTQEMTPFSMLGPLRTSESELAGTLGAVLAKQWNAATDTAQSFSRTDHKSTREVGIPNVTPSSTAENLSDRNLYPYLARTIPTDAGKAQAVIYYLSEIRPIKVDRLAVFMINDSFGSYYLLDLQAAATAHGIILEVFSYKDGASEEFASAIQQIKGYQGKYYLGLPLAAEWQKAILALYDAGLLGVPDKMWFFTDALLGVTTLTLPLNATNDPTNRNMDLGLALNRSALVSLYAPTNSLMAMGQQFQDFLANDDMVELYLASHSDGPLSNTTVENFRSFYVPVLSIWPLVSYDAVLAMGLGACQASNSFFTGPELYRFMINTSFVGASGHVAFDPTTGTRDPTQMSFSISNLLSYVNTTTNTINVRGVVSALIQGDGIANTTVPLIYCDGSTTPLQPDAEDMNLVSLGARVACWVLAGCVVVLAVFCACWTKTHSSLPTVQASQPIFLIILCAGACLMGLAIIPGTFQEPIPKAILDVACMIDPWLFSTGFCLAFAALFSKLLRINRVYGHAARLRRIQIRPRDVFWPLVVIMTLNVVILIVWTVVDPLVWTRVQVNQGDGPITMFGTKRESRGTCMDFGSSSVGSLVCLILLLAVNTSALLISNYESFKARKLPCEFNESSHIALTNLILFQAIWFGVPVLVVVAEEPTSLMVVKCMVQGACCLGVLLPIFIRKITARGQFTVPRKMRSSSFNEGSAGGSMENSSGGRGPFNASHVYSTDYPRNFYRTTRASSTRNTGASNRRSSLRKSSTSGSASGRSWEIYSKAKADPDAVLDVPDESKVVAGSDLRDNGESKHDMDNDITSDVQRPGGTSHLLTSST